LAKCPKCGKEVAPKKTWKMAGKPDKTGKGMELTIGLCDCAAKPLEQYLVNRKSELLGIKNHFFYYLYLIRF